MLKIGDYVGGLYKANKDGKEYWILHEDKINKITETRNGRKYYTKSKFYPLDAEEVDDNTKQQEEADGYVLTSSVFGLNEITRPIAEKWIEWANENMDKAISIML